MDKIRAAVADAIERAVRSRPATAGRAALVRQPGDSDMQRGQGLAEYALILGLIAIIAIASLIFLGDTITELFDDIINEGFRYVREVLGN